MPPGIAHAVQARLYDLGYENLGAFIAMFRKQTGLAPRKYLRR